MPVQRDTAATWLAAGFMIGAACGLLDAVAVEAHFQPHGDRPGHYLLLACWSMLFSGLLGVVLSLVAHVASLLVSRLVPGLDRIPALRTALLLLLLGVVLGSVGFLRSTHGFLLEKQYVIPLICVGVVSLGAGLVAYWVRSRVTPAASWVQISALSLLLALTSVAVVSFFFVGRARSTEHERVARANRTEPDIVFVMVDTVRADHLKAWGYSKDTMPGVENFFGSGVRFGNAVSHVAHTSPATMSMLTGLHPFQFGIKTNGEPLPDAVPRLSEMLGHHGYETAAFISSYTLSDESSGLRKGFAYFDDRLYALHHIHRLLERTAVVFLYTRLWVGESFTHRNAEAVNRAVFPWLEGLDDERPFFLFVHYYDPHSMYAPPREDAQAMGVDPEGPTTNRPIYSAIASRSHQVTDRELQHMVDLYDGDLHYADRHVRKLLDRIAALKRDRPTLYILTGDHGETIGEVWQTGYTCNHGRYVNQREISVPLFIRGPGFEGGRTMDTPVAHIDLAPTILRFVGLPVPDDMKGLDLLDLAKREAQSGRPQEREPLLSVTGGRSDAYSVAVRLGKMKLISHSKRDEVELYDLSADPHELVNLSKTRPQDVERASSALVALPEFKQRSELDPAALEHLRALGYVE